MPTAARDPRAVFDLAVAVAEAEAALLAPVSAPSALDWARQHATVVTPNGRERFAPYPYQVRFLSDPSPRRIVLKARQVGMSLAVAVEALHEALTRPDRQILLVSRNGDLARQLITYCRHSLAGLSSGHRIERENLSELVFANGSRILSLPATPATGRGFPATSVYLDEFAWADYADLIYDAVVPTLGDGGRLTVLSTPNGRANLFFRLWQGLEGGAWSPHRIRWDDCPRYTAEWADERRREMTRQAFAQEYDCDFVASGEAVFDADDLARCSDGHDPDPVGCSRYVTAWDIGRRRDHTVGITLGLRGDIWHVVAYERRLDPYPVVQAAIERRAAAFPGEHWVESNGPGDPVIENLSVRVGSFVTTAKTKTQAIEALQLLIQRGRFKHAEPQLGRELGLYQWSDEKLIQDSVLAAAIAVWAAEKPVGVTSFW